MAGTTERMSNPKPTPERTELRQATLKKLSKRAIKASGIDIPSIALVEEVMKLVTLQCEETRIRLADMVRNCIGHEVTDAHLERLAWILETHHVDEHGEPQINWDVAP